MVRNGDAARAPRVPGKLLADLEMVRFTTSAAVFAMHGTTIAVHQFSNILGFQKAVRAEGCLLSADERLALLASCRGPVSAAPSAAAVATHASAHQSRCPHTGSATGDLPPASHDVAGSWAVSHGRPLRSAAPVSWTCAPRFWPATRPPAAPAAAAGPPCTTAPAPRRPRSPRSSGRSTRRAAGGTPRRRQRIRCLERWPQRGSLDTPSLAPAQDRAPESHATNWHTFASERSAVI
jgi:hypothetical protein